MSKTPETDAAFKDIYKPPYRVGLARLVKLLMFARDLERQLAEAREQLKWKQHRVEVLQRVGSKLVEQRNRLANAIINAADVLAAVKEAENAKCPDAGATE